MEIVRGAFGVACMAYKRRRTRHADQVTRLEWCCGCVSNARRIRGGVVWANEICCPEHRDAPLRSLYPRLGDSDGHRV
jgi:hypothetical protein